MQNEVLLLAFSSIDFVETIDIAVTAKFIVLYVSNCTKNKVGQ